MSLQFDPSIITETSLLTLHDQHTVAEEHVVPAVGAEFLSTYAIPLSKIVNLRERPKQQQVTIPTGTTVAQVPGGPFVEVLTNPAAGQFLVNYTNGSITFNTADIGKNVLVSYTAVGSVVRARHINNISAPLVPFYNKLNSIVPDGGVDFTFPNDVTVTGDLNILGIINKIASEVLTLTDNILLLNSGIVDDGAPISTIGLEIARTVNPQGDLAHPQLLWTESSLTWNFNSTSAGPTGTRDPLLKVYDKGGVQVTRLTTAQETALVATLGASDGGLQWFNTNTSQFMGYNGTAAVILG
jgi:hypothetical protein